MQIMTNLEDCFAIEWPGFMNDFLNLFNVINLDLSWMLSAGKKKLKLDQYNYSLFSKRTYLFFLIQPLFQSSGISPCAFAMPFLTSFLVQATLLPLFAGTVYLAFYSRVTFMKCMQTLTKTKCGQQYCNRIQIAGSATVQLKHAKQEYAMAGK